MRFSNDFLDEIRDRVPISAVIGARVPWDRKKTNVARGDYWACCPFHGEKSPSFHCEDRKGRYHCFGCGVSGDHFRFLTDLEGLSFPEAVERIADMAGIAMPKVDAREVERDRARTGLQDVMELATLFFQDQLQSAQGAKARAYLRERGLSGRTIETFRLGYAPESRNALKEHLAGKGVPKDQIEACGLVVHGPDIPVSYDRFRDRIMFPILSSRDKVIAFGGRAMSPDAPAKYLNSNETELFHKGSVLYNFSRARRALQGADGATTIIAVEGYMDVIALHQAGIDNAVAPLGTALTENQLDLMWKIVPQPVLCFDGDGAGQRAAFRAVDLALPHLKPGRSVRFAMLPDGKDPDDLVKQDGRAPFDRVLGEARSLDEMVWLRETGQGRFDTPEQRAELEARLKQIVNGIADENVRRHYQQNVRDRLYGFFQGRGRSSGQGQGNGRSGRGNFEGGGGGFADQRSGSNRFGSGAGGRGGGQRTNGQAGAAMAVSDRLARSGMISRNHDQPTLRETVLALTIVNHPQLLQEDYDEISCIDFDSRDLQRLWPAVLTAVAETGAQLTREELEQRLATGGFDGLIKALDQQIRNARLWTATTVAALEDARECYVQALSLYKRAKALRRQKAELEREMAEAVEAGDAERHDSAMGMLREVQLEIVRMENQEAIIDGFGVMSGRVKGPAYGHNS
ncbi:DNA primase [Allorhizobium taibaishanense]|uniref:DNA primase n=1 Tax=Allorhizobium taibaishanense TaxID=887144 RepID=A0A1Q9A5K4_9HYPH|nr:DNA primase [Allorhizobium taibaishanense]MBB4006262.1 DNA primase [Allorhizobium taibaishanense]OLP49846.1 DNA primase [Allorhizobium taibaishanense]